MTERDILKKVVSKYLDAATTKVKDVMTSPPITVDYNIPLRKAIDLMVRKGLRRTLVTEKGRIVGTFTMRDILKHTRTCLHCGKEIMSFLESKTLTPS